MKSKFKKIIPLLLTTTMVFSQFTYAFGATSYIKVDDYVLENQKLVDGLTYEHKIRLTNIGNIDIYTLVYENGSPNVELEIFRSDTLGKRDKLTTMAKEENIIAGVNASFFDTSKSYSDILGLEKDNGEIFYARNKYNIAPQASAIMVNEDSGLFDMEYIVPTLTLTTEAGRSINITGYNTVSSFHNAAVIKGNQIDDTSYIDKNYSVYKLVTDQEGVIKAVYPPKTTTKVADDEYLITLPEVSYTSLTGSVDVGDKFNFSITANVNLDNYDTIVSGGGTLVEDGKVNISGIKVSENSRHPRTAIGVTKDGDIIQMVVDGRGESLGATLPEMANLMIEMGAYNAISLDGGGSSEIVKKDTTGTIQIENTPSDGAERKVTNGVGFNAVLKTGVASQVEFLNEDRTYVGGKINMQVLGKDQYYNNVNLEKSKITYSVTGVDGYFEGSYFIPQSAGTAEVLASYEGTPLSSQTITVKEAPTELLLEDSDSVLEPKGSMTFKGYVLDSDGYRYDVNSGNITWSVDNTNLATISNGVLTAKNTTGKVVVTASSKFGTATKTIAIGQDKISKRITGFESGETVSTVLKPSGVDGLAILSTDWVPQGKKSVKLRYGFSPNIDEKQVASAKFSGLKFDRADRIKFDMTTKAMNNAVTMTIVDSDGISYDLTMANSFSSQGKRTVVANLPQDISYPATISSINVEYQPSAEKTKTEIGAIYFDNIMTEKDNVVAESQASYPKTDKLATSTVSTNRLSVIGSVNYSTNKGSVATSSLQAKGKNSAKVYVSKVSPTLSTSITNTKVVSDAYSQTSESAFDTDVFTLKSSGKTLLKSQPEQWDKMFTAIENSGKKNIVIIANKSPLTAGYNEIESAAFTERLTSVAKSTGKNIYFVNGTSQVTVPTVTYHEYVRYIDLPTLSLSSTAVAPWSVDFYLENGDLKYNFSK